MTVGAAEQGTRDHALAGDIQDARLPSVALLQRMVELNTEAREQEAYEHAMLYEKVGAHIERALAELRAAERTLMSGVPFMVCGCVAGTHGTSISEIAQCHQAVNPWPIQSALIAAEKQAARRTDV